MGIHILTAIVKSIQNTAGTPVSCYDPNNGGATQYPHTVTLIGGDATSAAWEPFCGSALASGTATFKVTFDRDVHEGNFLVTLGIDASEAQSYNVLANTGSRPPIALPYFDTTGSTDVDSVLVRVPSIGGSGNNILYGFALTVFL